MKKLLVVFNDEHTLVFDEFTSPNLLPEDWVDTRTGLLLTWPDRVRMYPWSSIKYIEYPP